MPHLTEITRLENWSSLHTQFFWAYDGSAQSKSHPTPVLSHPYYAFMLRHGNANITYGKRREDYAEGIWIFPKALPGTVRFSDDARLLAIRFSIKWPSEISLFERERSITFTGRDAEAFSRATLRLTRYSRQHSLLTYFATDRVKMMGSLEHHIVMQARFAAWCEVYYKTFTNAGYQPTRFSPLSDRMRVCIRHLRHRDPSTPLYEKELAEIAGLSVSQLCKIFVQEMGATPNSYWNTHRLHIARLELDSPGRSIKEIAFSLGFSSPEHFTRWFSKQTGTTPRDYRKSPND